MSSTDYDLRSGYSMIPAKLVQDRDGAPVSDIYGDIYHSDSGACAQAQHVFLAGNDLPRSWQGRGQFTILETGFGLGLNFLATWDAWQADPQRCDTLYFISLEKHPFTAVDLHRAHSAWPQLAALAEMLHSQWPVLESGEHRLEFAGGRVVLRLIFGDAVVCLPKLVENGNQRVDAFYMDGFSPDRNPELWSPTLCLDLAHVATRGASLSTWSVAGSVRRALASAGFVVRKAPGFGSKRQMLCGLYPGGNDPAVDSAEDSCGNIATSSIVSSAP